MKIRRLVAGLLLIGCAGTAESLSACGDKFLMLGRGTRYQRSPAARQAAAILLYASPASEFSRALTALSVDAGLRKEGYSPTIAVTPSELDTALRARKWDVIVVDAVDSADISRRTDTPGGPHLVPVLTKPTKAELNQAKKLYHTVVNTPTRSGAFIDTIDDALDRHEDELRAARRKTAR